ncbi:MAG TPA: vanadium-dependent haloperoxidase [Chthonomonadaceae bacterium]|nr:vanadium-dependent haloperoxidase [Chthonomonadaceae bacterium]
MHSDEPMALPTPAETAPLAPADACAPTVKPGTSLNRRDFFGRAALLTAGVAGLTALPLAAESEIGPLSPNQRRQACLRLRMEAAQEGFLAGIPSHPDNGDEDRYPSRIGNFSKGLPHNARGEVLPGAYRSLLTALSTGRPADFENIQLGLGQPLTNPQAGLAFDMEGPDAQALAIPPAPALASAEEAGEAVELYWMALLRDVPFGDYATHPGTLAACAELSRLSDFRGPKQAGAVTPQTLFRGNTPGDLNGPFLSQFLWRNIPYGALPITQQMQTVVPGVDYLTSYDDWLNVQNGGPYPPDQFDPTPRYIRNLRDMGQWVHVDALYQAYLSACLILLGMNAPLDPGNPYVRSRTQTGFGTFGNPHVLTLVTEVATRALKAVWFQKWYVHRRLRPEAYGGLVHQVLANHADYPIHPDMLHSAAAQSVFSRYGTYLLPMAFPEGCPTHPAYGAGHATVAGACVTILKAWFDESYILPDPVAPNADGTALVPIQAALTVGGELNKLAANVAIGRNGAGVHWRSDYAQSILLGQRVALGLLREAKPCYNEPFSLTLTTFDGTLVTI